VLLHIFANFTSLIIMLQLVHVIVNIYLFAHSINTVLLVDEVQLCLCSNVSWNWGCSFSWG